MKNRYEFRNGFNVGKLRGAIANSGKTQATISEELDIHPNTLSKWTTGERVPSPEKLYKVLSACGWESFILRHLRMADFYEVPVVDDSNNNDSDQKLATGIALVSANDPSLTITFVDELPDGFWGDKDVKNVNLP